MMNRYYERIVRMRKKDYSETIEKSMAKFRLKTQATTDEFKNSMAKFEFCDQSQFQSFLLGAIH